MRAPILIGIILAAVLIAAGISAPLLQTEEQRTADEAAAQATQALGKLSRVFVARPDTAELLPAEDADLTAAVEQAAERLQEVAQQHAQSARRSRTAAAEMGLDVSPLPAVGTDAGGVRRSISGVEATLKENARLLREAINDARAAVGTNNSAVGVAEVMAAAQYVQGVALFNEAVHQRTQQAEKQAELMTLVSDWSTARSRLAQYEAIDVAPVITELASELETMREQRSEAQERVGDLRARVAARRDELARVEARRADANARLQEIQDQGFEVGNDDSFRAYRERYRTALEQVTKLDEQAQALRYGTYAGARLAGDDEATAELVGGELDVGLEELERKYGTAQTVAARWDESVAAIAERVEQLKAIDKQNTGDRRRHATRARSARDAVQKLVDEVKAAASAAAVKEDEALAAAESAARSFSQSQRTVDGWIRAAQELQREFDPDRKNERLKALIGAPYMTHFGASGEASARLLVARIHAQRVAANEKLLSDVSRLQAMGLPADIDTTSYEEQLEAARSGALETLETARTTLDRLSKSPTATSWVPLSALSAAHHLTARVDAAQAAAQLEQALTTMQTAVTDRQHSPYLQAVLPFLVHLQGPGGQPMQARDLSTAVSPAAPTPPDEFESRAEEEAEEPATPTEPRGPAPDQADEDYDFFLDG